MTCHNVEVSALARKSQPPSFFPSSVCHVSVNKPHALIGPSPSQHALTSSSCLRDSCSDVTRAEKELKPRLPVKSNDIVTARSFLHGQGASAILSLVESRHSRAQAILFAAPPSTGTGNSVNHG